MPRLKSITVEVPVPAAARWIARDSDGMWVWFVSKPHLDEDGIWHPNPHVPWDGDELVIDRSPNPDWTKTLRKVR